MSEVVDIEVILQVRIEAVISNGEPLAKQAEELIKEFGLELCQDAIVLHAKKKGDSK